MTPSPRPNAGGAPRRSNCRILRRPPRSSRETPTVAPIGRWPPRSAYRSPVFDFCPARTPLSRRLPKISMGPGGGNPELQSSTTGRSGAKAAASRLPQICTSHPCRSTASGRTRLESARPAAGVRIRLDPFCDLRHFADKIHLMSALVSAAHQPYRVPFSDASPTKPR